MLRTPPSPKWTAQPGLLRRLLRDPQPVLDELAETVGPVCRLGVGPMRIAVVGDPEALRNLFGTPTESFRWNHKFNLLAVVVGPGSMIVSDGADHTRRRSSVMAAFTRRRLNGWIPMIVERTDAVIDDLVDSPESPAGSVDLYRVGRSLVLEIVVRAMFGERLAARATEIGGLFQGAQDYIESPAIRQIPHPLPFTARARVRQDRRGFDAIIDHEIAHLRAHPSDDPLDVLATLVAEVDLSDSEIRDQVDTLIGAGYDTTAASLAWMLWRSLLEPGLWERLREEADVVFGDAREPSAPDPTTLARLELAEPGDARDPAAPSCRRRQPPRGRHRRGHRWVPHPEGHAHLVVGLSSRAQRRRVDRPAALRPGPLRRSRLPTNRRSPTPHGCRSGAVPATASASLWPRWN